MSAREWGGLGLVAVLGALHLPYPFQGDQALFTIFARSFAEGAVLYRDFWDVKQPGIFWFYGLAGRLFGFDEVGVHLLELILWLGFSLFLVVTLGHRFRSPVTKALLPLLTAGWYYASVLRPMLLTQIEILVGVPLFVALWLAIRPAGELGSLSRLVGAGVAGGIALILKLFLLPLLAAIWAVALIGRARDAPGRRVAAMASGALALALGVALPPVLAVLHLARGGALEIAAWTTFVYPGQAMAVSERPFSRLVISVGWFAVFYAPILFLAAVRLLAPGRAALDRLTIGLLTWIAAGAILVLFQLWWPYHLYLLAIPLGILAAEGLDALLERPRGISRGMIAALVVLALPAVGLTAHKTFTLLRTGLGLTPAARRAYQAVYAEPYRSIPVQAKAVGGAAPAEGSMYVFGDPLYLMLTDRPQAIPLNGWSPDMWTEAMWIRALADLEAARPATIVVEGWAADMMRERAPAAIAFLARDYRAVGRWPEAVWYARVSER